MTDIELSALHRVIDAADCWCDYLEENDREGEIPAILDAIKSLGPVFGPTTIITTSGPRPKLYVNQPEAPFGPKENT